MLKLPDSLEIRDILLQHKFKEWSIHATEQQHMTAFASSPAMGDSHFRMRTHLIIVDTFGK